jgi:hypothetical protein
MVLATVLNGRNLVWPSLRCMGIPSSREQKKAATMLAATPWRLGGGLYVAVLWQENCKAFYGASCGAAAPQTPLFVLGASRPPDPRLGAAAWPGSREGHGGGSGRAISLRTSGIVGQSRPGSEGREDRSGYYSRGLGRGIRGPCRILSKIEVGRKAPKVYPT